MFSSRYLELRKKKLLNQFSHNSVESWHMGHKRNREILVVPGSR